MRSLSKWVPIGIVLLIALLLRLPFLSGSFWLDEAAQVLESARPLQEQLSLRDDFQPPLFHTIVHFMLVISRAEMFLRMTSITAGLVTILVLYLLLRDKAGQRAAIVGAFFLAINPFHIFFSQELRPYALATCFACISWLALLASSKKHVARSKGIFVITSILGLYSMYLYPFVMLSQVVYIFVERRNLFRSTILLSLVPCLFFLPWLPSFLGQLQAGTALQHALPGWSQVVGTPLIKALPLVGAKFFLGQVELRSSPIFVAFAIFGMGVFVLACIALWAQKKYRFLIYWCVITILGAYLISFIVPVIQPKRVMIALPAFVGIVGVYAASHRRVLMGATMIFVLSTWLYWRVPKYQREDWRGVVTAIESRAGGRGATVLSVFPEPFAPLRWYARPNLHLVSLPVSRPALGEHVFLFEYLADLSDPHGRTKDWLIKQGYRETGVIDGGNVGFVRVYSSL